MSTENTNAVANVSLNNLVVSDIMSARGVVVGRKTFFGSMSASELREHFKAQGLKGNALTKKVHEALTNDTAARLVLATAKLQAMVTTGGYVPDVVEERKGTGCIRLVKPKMPKTKTAEEKRAEALKLLGLTEEDIALLAAK